MTAKMFEDRRCKVCGGKFRIHLIVSGDVRRVFCSKECRARAKAEANQRYRNMVAKAKADRIALQPEKAGRCPECGTAMRIPLGVPGRRRKFCSANCQKSRQYKEAKARRAMYERRANRVTGALPAKEVALGTEG